MKRKWIILAVFLAVIVLASAVPSARAQDSAAGAGKPATGSGPWSFSITPYMWAVSIDGKVTVGDYSASSSMAFSDIWKNMQAGGLVHMEARNGRFGFFVDPIYLKMRQDTTFRGASSGTSPPPTRDITLTVETWLVEFGVMYELGRWGLDNKKAGRAATLEVYGGGRYWYTHTNLDTTGPVNPTQTLSFTDPMIGLSFKADLTERVVMNLRGDIGGFGVGSDFSWNAAALFGYRFTPAITGFLGYRAIYLNYKTGDDPRFNMTMQGPITGIEFKF